MIFWRSHTRTYYLAFDLGTGSVSAVLFSLPANTKYGKPKVERVYRSYFDITEDLYKDRLTKRTMHGMRELLEQGLKNSPVPLESVIIGLSAPFYRAQIMHIVKDRDNPTHPIQTSELQHMIRIAEENLRQDIHMPKERAIRFFTKQNTATLVNGYLVANPIGVAGRHIEAIIRLEAIAISFATGLLQVLDRVRPRAHIEVTSVPSALLNALCLVANVTQETLILDIGAEITELSNISRGNLEKVVSLPIGSASIVRFAAEALGINFYDALFLLRRFSEGTANTDLIPHISKIVDSSLAQWKDLVAHEIQLNTQGRQPPQRVLLTGGGSLLLKYKDVLGDQVLKPLLGRNAEVQILQPASLQDFFEDATLFNGPEDFVLASLTLLKHADYRLPTLS